LNSRGSQYESTGPWIEIELLDCDRVTLLPPASTNPRTSNSTCPEPRLTWASPPKVLQGWPPPVLFPTILPAWMMPITRFQLTLLLSLSASTAGEKPAIESAAKTIA